MGAASETGRVLRESREAAGKSLGEMSMVTRINVKFLGELEAGTFASLPAIYRRTFLRTYARALGLDPDALPADDPPEAAPVPAPAAPGGPIAAGPPVEDTTAGRNPFSQPSQLRAMIIVVVLLLSALYFSVKWFASDPEPAAAGSDEPSAAAPESPSRPDTLPAFSGGGTGGSGASDSLVLRAASSESVWVHIVIDNDSTVEYTMPPGYALTLRARDNFLLAVGNPSGLTVSLNGRALNVLGSGDRPVKNVFLSRKSLAP